MITVYLWLIPTVLKYFVLSNIQSHHIVTEEDEGSPAHNLPVDHG